MKFGHIILFGIWALMFLYFGTVQIELGLNFLVFVDKILIILMSYFLIDDLIEESKKGAKSRK